MDQENTGGKINKKENKRRKKGKKIGEMERKNLPYIPPWRTRSLVVLTSFHLFSSYVGHIFDVQVFYLHLVRRAEKKNLSDKPIFLETEAQSIMF